MNTREAECMKIGARVFLGLGIHFWSQKYPKMSLSGCKFILKKNFMHTLWPQIWGCWRTAAKNFFFPYRSIQHMFCQNENFLNLLLLPASVFNLSKSISLTTQKNFLCKLWHCWFCVCVPPADINTSHSTFIHHIHYCDIISGLSFSPKLFSCQKLVCWIAGRNMKGSFHYNSAQISEIWNHMV